jgi:hypothetical protein
MRLLVFSSFALLAAGCSSPNTVYRNSALAPAAHPLSWDGRVAEEGRLRLEGTLTRTAVETNLDPHLHDTALHVPTATVEGAATLAISREVELGARVAYASYAWSQTTAVGTPPLPDHPSVSGFGPEIRVAIPLDRQRRVTFGFAGNFMSYSTPYAEWQRCPCAPGSNVFVDTSGFGGNAAYGLVRQASESHWAASIAMYPSVNITEDGRAGHVFGGLSAHTTFKNDGFTNTGSNGSTLESDGFTAFLALGYGVEFEPLRLSALVALPISDGGSAVSYALAGFLSIGVDLALWDGRDGRDGRDEKKRERRDGSGDRD